MSPSLSRTFPVWAALAVFAAIAVAPEARAEGKAEPPAANAAAKPGPELERLKYLVGNFTCDVTAKAGAVEQSFKTKLAAKWTLGSFFLSFHDAQLKAAGKPAGKGAGKDAKAEEAILVERDGYLGYAPGISRYVFSAFDNGGASLFLRAEAPGDVDQLAFKGTVDEGRRHVPVTWTFTRTEKGFRLVAERTGEDGEAQKQLEETCTRGK